MVPQQNEWLFTYVDDSGNTALGFGSDQNGMKVIVDGVTCSVDSVLGSSDLPSSMTALCLLWSSATGQVGVYFGGNYWTKTCSSSSGRSLGGGGVFQLGGERCSYFRHPSVSFHPNHRDDAAIVRE